MSKQLSIVSRTEICPYSVIVDKEGGSCICGADRKKILVLLSDNRTPVLMNLSLFLCRLRLGISGKNRDVNCRLTKCVNKRCK